MRTFVLDDSETKLASGKRFSPAPERAHYLLRVLRLSQGAVFPGQDSRGKRYLITLESETPCTLSLRREEEASAKEVEACFRELPEQGPDFPPIIFYQAILKGKKMDQVIRQATEAGADFIIPVLTDRSVPQFTPGEAEKKQKRWEIIVREAIQQSGATGTTLLLPRSLKKVIEDPPMPRPQGRGREVKLFFHERPIANGSLHGYLSGEISSITAAVGPEGGFSPKESEMFLQAGFCPLFFSGNILRAETAAIYGLAAIRALVAERDIWRLVQ
jgi:16S rRNA (uracil1498-N3)-methyltransferase